MVLKHIAQHPGLFVIAGPVLDPELFRRQDTDVIYIVAVPDRLKDGIGKPEK